MDKILTGVLKINNFFGHLRNILVHKYWVYFYGRSLGLGRWQLIMHDMSKFHPTEFFESLKYYQGKRSPIPIIKLSKGYSMAWLHHKGHNKHHPDYWVDTSNGCLTRLEMPDKYVKEMVADWMAAGRTYQGKSFTYESEQQWWRNWEDREKCFHPKTYEKVNNYFS